MGAPLQERVAGKPPKDWKAQHDLCCNGAQRVIDDYEAEHEQWRRFHAAVGLLIDAIPAELVINGGGFDQAFAPVLGQWMALHRAMERVAEQGGPMVLRPAAKAAQGERAGA